MDGGEVIEPGVRLIGDVRLGEGVSIAAPCEVMAKHATVIIGDGADIAGGVVISTADSHMRCLGLSPEIERRDIVIGHYVFVGANAVILGGTYIGHHSVVGAGVVLKGQTIPPYSRVRVQSPIIEPGFYAKETTTA